MAGSVQSINRPRLSLTVLSPKNVEKIHKATLEIIETVGVRFPLGRALDIWQAHGARVDRKSAVVRVPRSVIESALRQAPPAYTLAALDETQDLPLDGNHVYLGTDAYSGPCWAGIPIEVDHRIRADVGHFSDDSGMGGQDGSGMNGQNAGIRLSEW